MSLSLHLLQVRYCSAHCQAQHWKEGGHREECAALRSRRAAEE